MAKSKGSKGLTIPHKHLHSRISFLHQASSYLSLATEVIEREEAKPKKKDERQSPSAATLGAKTDFQSRHLLTQLRAVSLKSNIRIAPDVKHSICKRCNSLLVAGKTSKETLENESRGGKKPWADVLVIQCNLCGRVKRFPIGAKRVPKKKARAAVVKGQDQSTIEEEKESS